MLQNTSFQKQTLCCHQTNYLLKLTYSHQKINQLAGYFNFSVQTKSFVEVDVSVQNGGALCPVISARKLSYPIIMNFLITQMRRNFSKTSFKNF